MRPGSVREDSRMDFEDLLDEIVTSSEPINTLNDLERVINRILTTLPKLDRNTLRLEMENMTVGVKRNPTTKDLTEGLAQVQGYKDRLAEIYTLALREYRIRERCTDMLFDVFGNYAAKGSSADKRRGEATMRYPIMLIQLEAAETFLKEVEHVLANLKSAHESISRQVSIMQIQLQLGEVRREHRDGGSEAEEVIKKNGELEWDSIQ